MSQAANHSFRAIWDVKDVALIIIDYQPTMLSSLRSGNSRLIELNAKYLVRMARALNIPVVLSEVGVSMGFNKPTVASIASEAPGQTIIDRSSMDAWEDPVFHAAVKATGKRRLVFAALYTEICLAYPVVEAIQEGYEVTILTDAVGGLSVEAHERGIDRMVQAGAIPNTVFAYHAELFRDWKSPLVPTLKPINEWYLEELGKLAK